MLAAFSPPSVAGVATLLGTPEGATLAFAHFIAFDYFVGRWMALDALSRDIHPLLMAPLLVATLMVGPLGFAAYLVLRSVIAATRGELAQSFVDPINIATQA